MVLIHYKKTEHNQFLTELPGSTPIQQAIPHLVRLNNIRIEIDLFACALEDLATHGPLKPEQIRGLNTPELIENALVISPEEKKKWGVKQEPVGDQRYNEDPTHYRTGVILNEHVTKMLIECSNKAKKMISYKNVDQKIQLNLKELQSMVEEMKAALVIAYPNHIGLGEWETAVQLAKGTYDLEQRSTNNIDYLDEKHTSLWWAGKELLRGKLLNSYTGKNEKTKILVSLTKQGTGAPMRESPITKEMEMQMMAKWHKKQEEDKKLLQNNQDDYMNSAWANPKNLKNYLVGGGREIAWKPGK